MNQHQALTSLKQLPPNGCKFHSFNHILIFAHKIKLLSLLDMLSNYDVKKKHIFPLFIFRKLFSFYFFREEVKTFLLKRAFVFDSLDIVDANFFFILKRGLKKARQFQ